MGFRDLRVINEDVVAPGSGFATHAHRDMEILTYVLDGALEHKDSMGNGSVIRPGEVQRMTAGTGVTHSEHNPSPTESVHLLQIWILPERSGLEPSYEQRRFPDGEGLNTLRLLASRTGAEGSVTVYQDVALFGGRLEPGRGVSFRPAAGRHVWVQLARGAVRLLGASLAEGDGAAIGDESKIEIRAEERAELLLFDLR
jgi:redox-sensitive bicupin YhaK (pirin superfamily)